jgi:tetratricopeptide (TPR) repeat protein
MTPELEARLLEARRLDHAGQPGRAILAYKLVLRADPACVGAKVDLAGLLMVLGRHQEALDLCLDALAQRPGDLSAIQNLVGALLGLERYEEADARCRGLLEADPACAPAHLGLGMSLACRDRHPEAEAAFQRALALDPADRRARAALFTSLIKDKAWDRLYAVWMAMTDLDPHPGNGGFEKAMVHLVFGELEQGWQLYENRFALARDPVTRMNFPQPLWDGSPFPGRTLLLTWEQGFGDTLMFIRYAALARALGGRVVAQVQAPLLPVLRGCPGVDAWVAPTDPLPPFDLHLPLLSLPRVLQTRLDTIPAPIPYLRVPSPARGTPVRPSEHLKVGLVWAGSQVHKHDFLRTLPPRALEPLAALPGVAWYSLQVGYQGDPPWPLQELAPHLKDFGDTARALDKLDLLITVDTAVAHLAGAMARPVWLMLPLMPDWRWLLEGTTTPWYPTFRLFRQTHFNDWNAVVGQITQALADLMASRTTPRGT